MQKQNLLFKKCKTWLASFNIRHCIFICTTQRVHACNMVRLVCNLFTMLVNTKQSYYVQKVIWKTTVFSSFPQMVWYSFIIPVQTHLYLFLWAWRPLILKPSYKRVGWMLLFVRPIQRSESGNTASLLALTLGNIMCALCVLLKAGKEQTEKEHIKSCPSCRWSLCRMEMPSDVF